MAKDKKNLKANFSESSISFIGAILAVLAVRWLLFEPYVIPSGSMIPTLLVHDHILVNKLAYGIRVPFTKQWLVRFGEPQRGDVIVFRSAEEDGKFMIKRVVGTPGDTVEFTDSGQLLVNNEPVPHESMGDPAEAAVAEPFYPVGPQDTGMELENLEFYKDKIDGKEFRTLLIKDSFRWRLPQLKVGEGKLFLMGDNRDNSKDSRSWGELPQENVLGQAMFVWLSCEETVPVLSFLCNPTTLRWKRFFHSID